MVEQTEQGDFEPIHGIFGVPYNIYDKMIDALNALPFEALNQLDVKTLQFFSTADDYEKSCTRHQLGVTVFKMQLNRLKGDLKTLRFRHRVASIFTDDKEPASVISGVVELIDQCLRLIK